MFTVAKMTSYICGILVILVPLVSVESKPAESARALDTLEYLKNYYRMQNVNAANPDEDGHRNVTQLITSKGYPCEDHFVTTADGFLLSLQRLPYGKSTPKTLVQRPVVFLQHGLLDASSTWVMNMADQSLGFILADAGFDVWLGNIRGNTYSRRHVKYVPSDAQFWEWSWDQMADIDLPTMLRYVLRTTRQQDMFYIGHSQGTLIAFTRLSRDQDLAKKIKAFIALGPVLTVAHIKGLMKVLVDGITEEQFLFELFGVHEFLPNNKLLQLIASDLCSREGIRYICENFVFLLSGFNYRSFNVSRLPVYFSHTPAGTSVQNMVHFSQMVNSKRCQAYDYGNAELNIQHYNQSHPPVCNVSALTVPTYLFSGGRDFLSDPNDVSLLLSQLNCVVAHEQIAHWQHLDFIWSLDAASLVYSKIVDILHQHVTTHSDSDNRS
jgi:lysosomal acid lipase/cholesteryl ester hydrolase